MNDKYKRELIEKELDYLRIELHDLKECQIKFVTFAVTGTGFLFSIQSFTKFPNSPLIPLLIIIPTWWIFFDKAKTISRIIGYYRILETIYLENENLDSFCGWENARTSYRRKEEETKKSLSQIIQNFLKYLKSLFSNIKDHAYKFLKLITLQASSYWTITYGIFFGSSLICIYFSGLTRISYFSMDYLSKIIFDIFVISSFVNFFILWQLIWGKHSYDANERIWREIFKIEMP